jgi:hypothetical protein
VAALSCGSGCINRYCWQLAASSRSLAPATLGAGAAALAVFIGVLDRLTIDRYFDERIISEYTVILGFGQIVSSANIWTKLHLLS